MAVSSVRTLHYVFKVADRTSTVNFYRNVLGMKVTRFIIVAIYIAIVAVV